MSVICLDAVLQWNDMGNRDWCEDKQANISSNTESYSYGTTNHPPLNSTLSRHYPHSLNSHTPQPLQLSILLIIQSSSWIVPPLPPIDS